MKITNFDFHNSLNIENGSLELNVRDFDWFKNQLEEMTAKSLLKHGSKKPEELVKVVVLDTETTGIEDDDEII